MSAAAPQEDGARPAATSPAAGERELAGSEGEPQRKIGLGTATSLVVASMIGTGVFTTTGLVLQSLPSSALVLLCWAIGGLAALCGALAYAELGAALPGNGGEYYYLSRLLHPLLGFLSAWASLVVGFAAPLAAIALAFGSYLEAVVPGTPPRVAGAALLVGLSTVHVWRVSAGARLQNVLTLGKVALIAGFVALGAAQGGLGRVLEPAERSAPVATPASFALGLLLVSFAYTGWNAASYVAGEVERPARTLPRALALGTFGVMVLYLALNVVFLASAPLVELRGVLPIGHVAATHLLGPVGGKVLSTVVLLGLLSTVSAIIVTGPRVYEAVGRDFPRLAWLSRRTREGGPWVAIVLQAVLALSMMLTAGFAALLTYVGFILAIFGALTVSCTFVLRRRGLAMPFRALGHPVPALIYLGLMVWMVASAIVERPVVALAGLGTIVAGLVAYLLSGQPRMPLVTARRPRPGGPEGSWQLDSVMSEAKVQSEADARSNSPSARSG